MLSLPLCVVMLLLPLCCDDFIATLCCDVIIATLCVLMLLSGARHHQPRGEGVGREGPQWHPATPRVSGESSSLPRRVHSGGKKGAGVLR